MAVAISGHNANYASEAVRRIREHDEEVHTKSVNLNFPGQREAVLPLKCV